MQKNKHFLFLLFVNFFFMGSLLKAQPLHQPIPNYTNDLTYNRVGHSSSPPVVNIGGMMEMTVGGIGATATEHYLCHNGFIDAAADEGMILVKKNALNGATINTVTINIGMFKGLAMSNDECKGLLLDPSLGRVYLFGQTNSDAFILCYNMSTLTLVSTFGTGGLQIIETNAAATGLVLTGVGNNFLTSINKNDGTIELKEYTSALGLVMVGNFNLLPSFTCTANSLKKGPNGRYYMVGGVKNTSGAESPMIYDFQRNTSSYGVNNTSSPVLGGLGNGNFRDFDFYVNPSPANPATYQCDIIAVGNTTAVTGIYARYIINNSTSYYTPDASYKNTTSLPGTATTTPVTGSAIIFTRCVTHTTGYATVMGYYASGTSPYSDKVVVGYLTPTGSQYVITYQTPTPTGASFARVHKGRGMIKDLDGNVLVSGCTTGTSYTTIKLSNSYDCRPSFNLKGSSSRICIGDAVSLSANISTPNCTLKWEIVSPTSSVIYNGIPVSLIQYPTVNTTYLCTVTNNATGCTSIATLTVIVDDMTASFSLTPNLNPLDNFYTLFATPTTTNVGGIAGFGYAWYVDEIVSSTNQTVISGSSVSNPSCWWNAPMTNDFNGYDGPYFTTTGLNPMHLGCGNPAQGHFTAGHTYRITRGTWSTNCAWRQYSAIVYMSHAPAGSPNAIVVIENAEAPDYSGFAQSSGITEIENTLQNVSIFPNPSTGIFTITFKNSATAHIEILDLLGQKIQSIEHIGLNSEIDLSATTKGIYIVNITSEGKTTTEKICIK